MKLKFGVRVHDMAHNTNIEYLASILNKINIVSKELHDNILHIKVKSKSGEYNFKFKKA